MRRKPTIPPLFKHQEESVRKFSTLQCGFDTSDPGTGKTRVMIELIQRTQSFIKGATLVVCPKSLMQSAWGDDIKKFAPELVTSIAAASNRVKAFAAPADIYVTNTDAVVWLAKQPKSFFKNFVRIIVDESSAFKHRTSQRSRALNQIKKHFQYRFALTGTPNANIITDIWNQVFFLDNGQRLGRVFSHFRRETCYPVQVGPDPRMVKWHEREHAASAIASLIQDITVRHVFEECIDIPPNTETIVQYYAPPGQLKAYEQMRKHKVAELENQIVTAVNAAVVMGKLLQIASGALYDSNGNVAKVDSGRYEMICDLIESRKQCVVFFQWKHQRDELVKQFEKAGITFTVLDGETPAKDRAENVRLFQAGFYRVMLAHPQSAAHGLTLTRATTTIWASPSHNVEHVLQGNRRTYRAGQTQKTETIYILAAGTIEAEVHRKMSEKNIRQGDMLEWMKSLFKGGL